MGARFVQAAMLGSIAWYALHWRSSGLPAASMALRILACSFLGGAAGKIIGIFWARVRAPRNKLFGRAIVPADKNLAGSDGGSVIPVSQPPRRNNSFV